jgi:NADH-quinone oxidoreductase subunit L
MRYYGALRKEIPLTFWAMTIGTLAITGVGVIGIFGFAGFYSKDAIIESAFASGSPFGMFAFAVAVFAALLTSFYSWRLVFLTFFGKARWAESEHIQHALHGDHDHHPDAEDAGHDTHAHEAGAQEVHTGTGGYHPHESPWTMLVPLALLALGALLAGFVFHDAFIDAEGGQHFWAGSVAFDAHLAHESHLVPLWVKLSATAVMLLGLGIAFYAYIRNTAFPAIFVSNFRLLYLFFLNKWYFDELYNILFVRPSIWLGRQLWKRGDERTIDRFGPDGAAAAIVAGTKLTGRLQTGYLYTYALVMLLGVAAATTWVMAR